MGTLDKRVEALENAAGVDNPYYTTLVIFDEKVAEVCRNWAPNYYRSRSPNEPAEHFEARVLAEAAKYGVKPSVMTRPRYDELVAQLMDEI